MKEVMPLRWHREFCCLKESGGICSFGRDIAAATDLRLFGWLAIPSHDSISMHNLSAIHGCAAPAQTTVRHRDFLRR
jgi:hypothetical protein